MLLLVALVVAAIGVWSWRTRVNIETGQPHHRVLYSFGTFLGARIIAFWIVLRRTRHWFVPRACPRAVA